MELSLRSLAMSLSPGSSASGISRDGRCRESSHRHRRAQRGAADRTDRERRERDADGDVYHRHRKNRQRESERRRRHTSSSLTDRSMPSSRGSSHRNSDELSLASTCDDRPSLNLPLDREFLPMDKQDDDEEQEKVRDQVICMIFDLPESTKFYQDFSCAIASTLAMHGRMYPTSSHVCFYSNVFGRERKILIPYESIRGIEKTTTMVFQHSIRLATFDKDEYTFTSFWGNNRDSCYDLIVKTRDRVLRELRPTTGNTSCPALPASPTARSSAFPASAPDDESEEENDDEVDAGNKSEEEPTHEGVEISPVGVGDDEVDQTAPLTLRRHSVVSDVDTVAPKDISMTQVLEQSFSVSVDTFMRTFFLDNAPFGLDKFGEQTGSTEMTVNPWMSPLEEDKSFGMTRSLQFRVPIDAPIGPKSSQVDVLQCLKKGDRGVKIVESSTRLVDIPYGDYFSVEDRWTIVPHSSNPDACKLFIELKVVFGKSTFWKNTIEARAISDNRAKWEKWVGMAKDFLTSRTFLNEANCAPESPPTSSTSSEKAEVQDAIRKEQECAVKRRSKSCHRHRNSTASTVAPATNRPAPVKVFPWLLVLLLLLVILRLQMTLSSIEQSLQMNTHLIGELQRQIIAGRTIGDCPATA